MNIKLLILSVLVLFSFSFAQPPYLLVVDASGSMDDTLPPDYNQTKMEAAKIAAKDFVDQTNAEIGLIVFEDCDSAGDVQTGNIKLVQDFTTDKSILKTKIDALQATSDTAIADALKEARGYLQTSRGRGTVILITDGEETCDGDPALEAGEIYNKNIGIVHVIGYLIGDEAEQKAKEIAQAGGGKYYPVNNTADLERALGSITQESPSFSCCPGAALLILVPFVVLLKQNQN